MGPLSWVWNHLCIIGSTMKTFITIEFERCSIAIKNSINWVKLRYINNQKINKGGSVKWFFYGWIFENWWKILKNFPKNIFWGGISITIFGNKNYFKKNLWNINKFFSLIIKCIWFHKSHHIKTTRVKSRSKEPPKWVDNP